MHSDGTIRIGVANALIILFMVAITVPAAKFIFGKWTVPGITPIVAAI